MPTRIKTVEALREQLAKGQHDFAIVLNGGILSRKYIHLNGSDLFDVFNAIDDTEQTLSEDGLYKLSNIGEAMDKGAFFAED